MYVYRFSLGTLMTWEGMIRSGWIKPSRLFLVGDHSVVTFPVVNEFDHLRERSLNENIKLSDKVKYSTTLAITK